MRDMCIFAAMSGLLLCACGTSEWVNANNPNANYALDYNACQTAINHDPKLQQGSQYPLLQATERSMTKKGWVLRWADSPNRSPKVA